MKKFIVVCLIIFMLSISFSEALKTIISKDSDTSIGTEWNVYFDGYVYLSEDEHHVSVRNDKKIGGKAKLYCFDIDVNIDLAKETPDKYAIDYALPTTDEKEKYWIKKVENKYILKPIEIRGLDAKSEDEDCQTYIGGTQYQDTDDGETIIKKYRNAIKEGSQGLTSVRAVADAEDVVLFYTTTFLDEFYTSIPSQITPKDDGLSGLMRTFAEEGLDDEENPSYAIASFSGTRYSWDTLNIKKDDNGLLNLTHAHKIGSAVCPTAALAVVAKCDEGTGASSDDLEADVYLGIIAASYKGWLDYKEGFDD